MTLPLFCLWLSLRRRTVIYRNRDFKTLDFSHVGYKIASGEARCNRRADAS